ncbi:MAG: preprotein translocase subunit YajC [Oscillospiraceae bacterium]|nr:preprotein translocase subunit YajC [Oscillospiraceae bacterium]
MESMLMIAAMIAIMYFFMIRPENKRKKQAQEMRDNLKKGDIITSIGGIVGKIVYVTPKNTVIIETSEDRVRLEIAKWAVSSLGVQDTEQAEASRADSGEKKEAAVSLDKKPETQSQLNGAPVEEETKS